jgi:hypothetical protein
MAYYEKALSHYADHALAIVGLSELLLDIYTQKIGPEPPELPTFTNITPLTSISSRLGLRSTMLKRKPLERESVVFEMATPASIKPQTAIINLPDSNGDIHPVTVSPEELNRLAARDRAYGLLNTLTKLGSGWDYSEAWFTLAKAYEHSGQIEKAKEVLWWCVELEDTRPLRHWRNVTPGGFGVV